MLRSYRELSEGQRFRFDLAMVMSRVKLGLGDGMMVVLADEFCSLLDRETAGGVARNLRKMMDREGGSGGLIFVGASGHDDLLGHLRPSVLIDKGLGDSIEIVYLDLRDIK